MEEERFLTPWNVFKQTDQKNWFLAEVFVLALQPIPFVRYQWFYLILDTTSFLRIYLFIRCIRDAHPVYENREQFKGVSHIRDEKIPVHEEIGYKTVFKLMFEHHSISALVLITVVSVVICSLWIFWAERECWINLDDGEYVLGVDLDPELRDLYRATRFDHLDDSVWFTFVTMTTCGYGDLHPNTNFGRAVATVAVLIGLVNASLVVSVITTKMLLSDFESYLIRWNSITVNDDRVRNLAARAIQNLYRNKKLEEKEGHDEDRNCASIMKRQKIVGEIRSIQVLKAQESVDRSQESRLLNNYFEDSTTKLSELEADFEKLLAAFNKNMDTPAGNELKEIGDEIQKDTE